jgi:hypothetical protein
MSAIKLPLMKVPLFFFRKCDKKAEGKTKKRNSQNWRPQSDHAYLEWTPKKFEKTKTKNYNSVLVYLNDHNFVESHPSLRMSYASVAASACSAPTPPPPAATASPSAAGEDMEKEEEEATAAKPEPTEAELTEADGLKSEANKFFKEEKYNDSIELYGKAIELNPVSAVLYANRFVPFKVVGKIQLYPKRLCSF